MKNIFGLILIVILITEFFIYFSDFDIVGNKTIIIIAITLVICVAFIFSYFKNSFLKISLFISTIIIALSFFIFEVVVGTLKGIENLHNEWKIDQFEIQILKPFRCQRMGERKF